MAGWGGLGRVGAGRGWGGLGSNVGRMGWQPGRVWEREDSGDRGQGREGKGKDALCEQRGYGNRRLGLGATGAGRECTERGQGGQGEGGCRPDWDGSCVLVGGVAVGGGQAACVLARCFGERYHGMVWGQLGREEPLDTTSLTDLVHCTRVAPRVAASPARHVRVPRSRNAATRLVAPLPCSPAPHTVHHALCRPLRPSGPHLPLTSS